MSKKVKTNGTVKTMAEVSDISCWPTATSGRVFYPGTRYNLGALNTLNYSLSGAQDGAEWFFTFESPATATTVVHPTDVTIHDFEVDPNSHVEVSILQIGDGESVVKELIGVCKEKS